MQQLIVIVGPTSSGKTKLAVELARKFNGEIVSADSRQVYRDMDIGTGKDLALYGFVPYHLIDIVSPRTHFTLAQYQKRAYRTIEDILRREKMPILAGGTGLYVQAVVDGYMLPQAPPNRVLRKKLAALSLLTLRAKLRKLDPTTYCTIDKNNRRRLERAIEICAITGQPLAVQRIKHAPSYDMLMLGLEVPRAVLHKRINTRLKVRLKQGMVQEVERLHSQGVSWKRLESFGLEYKWASCFLRDRDNYETMVCGLSRAIKDFARRQMTWFKRDKRIVWVKNSAQARALVSAFLKS